MDINKPIKLTLEFTDFEDLATFIQRVTGGGSRDAEPLHIDSPIPINLLKVKAVNRAPAPMPAGSPFDLASITTPVHTLDDGEAEAAEIQTTIPGTLPASGGSKVKGIEVKAALEEFKNKFGKAEAKRILEYFGAGSIRELDKAKYADFMTMMKASLSTVPASAPMVEDGGRGIAKIPPPPMDDDDDMDDDSGELAAPEVVTAEMLKTALTAHKAKWGMENTLGVVKSIGYNKPSEVPTHLFRSLFIALSNFKPVAVIEENNGVDLSMFD
jgi:hypothetical protein